MVETCHKVLTGAAGGKLRNAPEKVCLLSQIGCALLLSGLCCRCVQGRCCKCPVQLHTFPKVRCKGQRSSQLCQGQPCADLLEVQTGQSPTVSTDGSRLHDVLPNVHNRMLKT